MSTTYSGSRTMDIGRVLSNTFGLVRRNAVLILLQNLVTGVITIGAVGVLAVVYGGGGRVRDDGVAFLVGLMFILGLVAQFAFLQCVVAYAGAMELRGRKPTFGGTFSFAIRDVFPVVFLFLVIGAAVGLGWLLLLVPGILLQLIWYVTVPAYVSERQGLGGALSSSVRLTENNRWLLLAFLLVMGAVNTGLGLALGLAFGALGFLTTAAGQAGVVGMAIATLIVLVVEFVAMTLLFAVNVAAPVAAYMELKALKEPVGDQVARTFA